MWSRNDVERGGKHTQSENLGIWGKATFRYRITYQSMINNSKNEIHQWTPTRCLVASGISAGWLSARGACCPAPEAVGGRLGCPPTACPNPAQPAGTWPAPTGPKTGSRRRIRLQHRRGLLHRRYTPVCEENRDEALLGFKIIRESRFQRGDTAWRHQ